MAADPDDALTRYGHVRTQLAAADHAVEALELKAHCSGHGSPLEHDSLELAREKLDELAESARSFADAAAGLRGALE